MRDLRRPAWLDDGWFVDCVERLFADYQQHHPLSAILAVARQCRTELDGSGTPASALPELVERLARQRLTPETATAAEQGTT